MLLGTVDIPLLQRAGSAGPHDSSLDSPGVGEIHDADDIAFRNAVQVCNALGIDHIRLAEHFKGLIVFQKNIQ